MPQPVSNNLFPHRDPIFRILMATALAIMDSIGSTAGA
jgi:hypothetical protein